METFAAKPQASIPEACDNWTETHAAYRFLANDEVTWDGILAPHWARTMERMTEHQVDRCIQDMTELDFNGQDIEGLGPLNYEARRGMFVHPTYAVSVQREPLGLLDGWMWARQARGADGQRPASVKESERWIEGYERVAEQAAQLPATRLVYVADREADMMGMLRRAAQLGTPADWLVRAKYDRCLADGEGKRLWAETTADMPLGEISFTMEGRGKQKARQVRQQVWAKRVLLRDGKRGKIEATKKKAPAAPGMNEVLRMVARVGGFLARKHDGEPGVRTIWRGLQDVHVSAQTIRTLREMGALQD